MGIQVHAHNSSICVRRGKTLPGCELDLLVASHLLQGPPENDRQRTGHEGRTARGALTSSRVRYPEERPSARYLFSAGVRKDDLWCGVGEGALRELVGLVWLVLEAGQPHVRDLGHALQRQQDVAALQVPAPRSLPLLMGCIDRWQRKGQGTPDTGFF